MIVICNLILNLPGHSYLFKIIFQFLCVNISYGYTDTDTHICCICNSFELHLDSEQNKVHISFIVMYTFLCPVATLLGNKNGPHKSLSSFIDHRFFLLLTTGNQNCLMPFLFRELGKTLDTYTIEYIFMESILIKSKTQNSKNAWYNKLKIFINNQKYFYRHY